MFYFCSHVNSGGSHWHISVPQFLAALDPVTCKQAVLSIVLDDKRPREDGIWVAIDRAFATPVSNDDEARDYIPTQIIAELFKAKGYDGLAYKSLLSDDGFNLALFNLNHARVIRCALVKVASSVSVFRKWVTSTSANLNAEEQMARSC